MTTDERTTLLALIAGHKAAMDAQVNDPNVPLEFMNEAGEWQAVKEPYCLFDADDNSVEYRTWHRLAPAPKMVDLDQSDFLGPNRVTHLRFVGLTFDGFRTDSRGIEAHGERWSWDGLVATKVECSRDGGATFSVCSKPAP